MTDEAKKTTTKKTPAKPAKKEPVPLATRLETQLKRGAVGGKLSSEELERIAELSKSLIVFVS